jgi:hypothetical protein
MPHDDPERQAARVKVRYPIVADRILGLGELPGLRLQRAFARREGQPLRVAEQVLVWCHWLWFIVPHGTIAYHLAFHRDRFPRGAALMYAVFDLGVTVYWVVPTAPPWYAAKQGLMDDGLTPVLRRMMVEYGEEFWGSGWVRLYGLLGGNPLAAMPSLHFATSVMAAHLLAETGPLAGTIGWAYAGTLGVALVYLGEHYVVDLAAGLALTEGIRRAAPAASPLIERVSAAVQALEARARA